MSKPMQNPYSSPTASPQFGAAPSSLGRGAADLYRPLYDSLFFIRLIAWVNIVMGALYSLLIVTIIITWVPIWMGICLNSAADAIKNGYESGNQGELYRASNNLATYFKILGIIFLIWLTLLVLYIVFMIVMLLIGFIGAAAAANASLAPAMLIF